MTRHLTTTAAATSRALITGALDGTGRAFAQQGRGGIVLFSETSRGAS